MTEDTQKTETSDETITVSKKQYDEAITTGAEAAQAKANLTNELVDVRKKKQEAEEREAALKAELEAARKNQKPDDSVLDAAKAAEIAKAEIVKTLAEREADTVKVNKESAYAAFYAKHKAFHPDNDAGGLKMAIVQKQMDRFNTSSLKSEADYLNVLEDAARLSGAEKPSDDGSRNPNPQIPNGSGGDAKEVDDSKELSAKEANLINRSFDGDKERYLKIRNSRPEYVKHLLQYAQD